MKHYNSQKFVWLKSTYLSKCKEWLLFFLLIFIFQWSNAQIIGPGDWSSIRLYGHAYDIEDFSPEEYEWIANHFYYFTIEKRHAREDYGAISSERASAATAAKIVENNSNTHPLFYWNTKVVYDNIYETVLEKIDQNPSWSSGNNGGGNWTETAYASEEFRDWFVAVVEDQVNNNAHAGTFLDAALSVGGHISPAAGEHLKDMMEGMSGPTIFNGFGPNTPYARFDYLETAEGVFLEHFFKTQCDNLAKGKKMLDDLLLVPNDKIIIANAGPETTFWNTTDHKFSLAAFLIIANDNSYYHWMPSPNNWSSDYLMFWDDDFGKYLGPPKGAASVNGYVYTREFDNAMVTIDLQNVTSSIEWGNKVPPAASDNLALNGSATQSTTLNNAQASRAIDGNTQGSYGSGSVTAAEGPNAWWQVDLGNDQSIGDINIFNRTDECCLDRLSNFTLYVIDINLESIVLYFKGNISYL